MLGQFRSYFSKIYVLCKFGQNEVVVWAVELTICKILYFKFFVQKHVQGIGCIPNRIRPQGLFLQKFYQNQLSRFLIEPQFFGVKGLLNVIFVHIVCPKYMFNTNFGKKVQWLGHKNWT